MQIRNMTVLDLGAGLRLNEIAGWNQTAADWRRFLEASPTGCFVAEADGQVRGTVTTIPFEDRFAWIGMVLVDPQYRGKGFGTRLLQKAIEYLEAVKIPSIKLDATSQGKPLYEKLGFVTEYEIERWSLRRSIQKSEVPEFSASELPASLMEWDRDAFGADRSALLQSLHVDAPKFTQALYNEDRLRAYALGRRGSFADHLGPWIADEEESARKVLERFLAASNRETLIVDCPQSNVMVGSLLKSSGFNVARNLTRMYRGVNHNPGRPQFVCAITGPEFG
jgi:GNAT superfamily N-acetyltransferase